MQLPHKLTTEEFCDRSKKMSDAHKRLKAAEDRLKTVQSQIKAEIVALEGEFNMHSEIVSAGEETRETDCTIVYDWESKQKQTVRADTGEIVRVDPIDEEDLQEELSH